MKEYYAHPENHQGKKHILSKHLHRTATFAESFSCQENYKTIFKLAGLLHDLSKYQTAFQHYLANGGERGSVPHAAWGARDMPDFVKSLKHQLRLTDIIRGCRIPRNGRAIRNLSAEERLWSLMIL